MSNNYYVDWQSGNTEGIPDKQNIVVVQKRTDSTSSSITLTGKGLSVYGEIQQENFLHILEHFASATPPLNPTIGQLWFNTGTGGHQMLYQCVHYEYEADLAGLFTDLTPSVPKYFTSVEEPQKAWIQVWPAREVFVGLREYNALAAGINTKMLLSGDARLPIYDTPSKLRIDFRGSVFKQQFDNDAWVKLLVKLKEGLLASGKTTSRLSPVGFINDGRPVLPLSGYTSGWRQSGQEVGDDTMQMFYQNTLQAYNSL